MKSYNHPDKDKEEYMERRVIYHKSMGVPIDHADVLRKDFGMSLSQFFKTPLTDEIRIYLYKARGKYNNNVKVR